MWSDDVLKGANLAEALAAVLLQRLGYRAFTPAELEAERSDTSEVALVHRIDAALRRLNPWLPDDQVSKAVRAVTHIDVASLIDANRDLWTTLTMGATFEDEGRTRRVRYFDFDHPHDNDFTLARELWIEDGPRRICLDLVLFVNGIPLAVIECTGAATGDLWKAAAIQQLRRYQESGERARRLFSTVQVLVATCRRDAVYGTVGTPERLFAEWRDPFPRTISEIEQELGRKVSAQDVLIYGLLAPANLLDIFRNFILFDAGSGSSGPRKVLARYHQFRAVNAALARIAGAKALTGRGGIIWHTQGSGERLTMLWLALRLKRDARYQNPTIVMVTDRSTQNEQIAAVFRRHGVSDVVSADSSAHLRGLLGAPTGSLVTTTIQKFANFGDEARTEGGGVGAVTTSSDLFVLVKEAHRTQYGSLAARMRAALPNACFIGFTTTPISRQDRSTLNVFGSYIDTYTFQESVKDGATVPIFYERRLPSLRVMQAPEDRDGEDVSDADPDVEEAHWIRGTLAGSLERIEAICSDLVEHYRSFIQPGGFKALIVAANRPGAVDYKETLDRLHAPESAVLISGTSRDPDSITKHVMRDSQRAQTIDRFLDAGDPLSILVVCEMLLTDFDAPILQVLYLDAPLREHALLQAAARVNRVAEDKVYGLVVDYWGVSSKLNEALAIFSPRDVKDAMTPKSDELPRLQGRHAAALRYFLRVPDKEDLDACIAVLVSEGARAEFDAAFHHFARSLEVMLPDPKSLPYVDDLRWFAKIREAAGRRFGEQALQIPDLGAKVKLLINDVAAQKSKPRPESATVGDTD